MAIFILGVPFALVLSLLLLDPRPLTAFWWLAGAMLAAWAGVLWRRGPQRLHQAFGLGLALLLGWQLAGLGSVRFAPWALQTDRSYHITGTVSGLPDSRFYRHRLLLRPDCVSSGENLPCDRWSGESRLWPVQLEISIPRQHLKQSPRPGQRWEFNAHFIPPESSRNPGGFDVARWYRSQHVVARFQVGPGDSSLLVEDSAAALDRARFALREALVRQAENTPAVDRTGLAIPLALVTGDRSLMQQEQWALFNATGTTHLVAISGSHIVLVAGVVMWLLQFLLRRWIWLTHRVPASHVAAAGAFATACLYGAIAGLGLPVQRALVMLAVFVVLQLAGRVQQLWLALALAFCLVLVWDPMAVYALGFWLSFMAVYWILWMSGGAVFRPGWVRGWLRVQAGIFVGLAPVLLWQLQNVSLVSGITNAFAMPLVGMVLTPLALVWALAWGLIGDAANALLIPAGWLTDVWLVALGWFADLRYAVLQVPPRPVSAMLLGLAGSLWICSAGLPARWLAPLLFLPLLQPLVQSAQREGELWLRDSGGPLQLAIVLPDRALFVGASPWPQLLASWQQGFLTYWGIGVPALGTPLEGSAAFWSAESWTFTQLPLQTNGLGEPEVQQIRLGDLCQQDALPDGPVQTQVLYRQGARCVVRLELGGESWLLWPTLSQSAQQSLLQTAKSELAVPRILFNPARQDRLLPALLSFWQQQGAELILTDAPAPELLRQLEHGALKFRVLAGSGPLRFTLHRQPVRDGRNAIRSAAAF